MMPGCDYSVFEKPSIPAPLSVRQASTKFCTLNRLLSSNGRAARVRTSIWGRACGYINISLGPKSCLQIPREVYLQSPPPDV